MRHLARTELKAFDKTITEAAHRNQIFRFASVPTLMSQPEDQKTIFTTPFWALPYGEPTDATALTAARGLVHVRTDRRANVALHRRVWEAVAAAVRSHP